MGRHQDDGSARRGIATWPLVSLAVVVLLAISAGVYLLFLRKSEDAGTECTGNTSLTVMASAGASPAARALSTAFNATSPTSRSSCLTTSIATVASAEAHIVVERKFSDWQGNKPGVWISDDPTAVAAVDASAPEVTAGRDTTPLATSPVVLAMRPDGAAAAGGISWADLSSGKPALVLTDPRTNRASAYALQSMLADGEKSVTAATVKANSLKVRKLSGAKSDLPTTGDALDELGAGTDGSAVPVTEADLAVYNSEAAVPLDAVYPSGAVAGDEVYVIPLAGDWVDPSMREAATKFATYARSPEGKAVLAAAHLRVPGAEAAAGAGITSSQQVTAMAPAGPDVPTALAAALGFTGTQAEPTNPTGSANVPTSAPVSPAAPTASAKTSAQRVVTPPKSSTTKKSSATKKSPPVKTPTSPKTPTKAPTASPAVPATSPTVLFLLDTSDTWRTEVDGRTRLDWLQDGLNQTAAKAGRTSIGLWQVSSIPADGHQQVLAPGKVNPAAFAAAVDAFEPGGARRNYPALIAAVQSVGASATAQRPVKIILVTDGPDDTPGVPRAEVIRAISAVTAANPNVTVHTIGVGEAFPDSALQELATAGKGTFTPAATTPELPAALLAAFAAR